MKITTGKTPLAFSALVAILSLSIVVNLPGLAITPMLGTLSEVFPGTTQLEKQLLSMLPNLLIIPCLLLSGWLAQLRCKITVVVWALVLYSLCGIAYLFASSMVQLIIISCLLGVGAGLLIPFSTGLLADTFAGEYRMRQMGYQSGISNMTLVGATFAVGLLSGHRNWHLPFVVYLAPLIPLALSWWLRRIPQEDLHTAKSAPVTAPAATPAAKTAKGSFIMPRLLGAIGAYAFVTFATVIISYFCPFLIEKEHWSTELAGTVTSIYFFFIFMPGFFLAPITKILKGGTLIFSALAISAGLALFAFIREPWAMMVGAGLMGLGYGIFQPILYNKAPQAVTNPAKSTMSLALVLTANYAAIAVTPVIIDTARSLLHASNVTAFAFIFNFVLSLGFLAVVIIRRKHFTFSID